jgi:hypothetical protein
LEVVATTGVGGVTACSRVALDGSYDAEPPSEPRLAFAAEGRVRAGEPTTVRLRLDGVPSSPQALEFLVTTLEGGAWRNIIAASRSPDGTYMLPMTFPAPGDYPVIPLGSGLGDRIAPLIIEVRS